MQRKLSDHKVSLSIGHKQGLGLYHRHHSVNEREKGCFFLSIYVKQTYVGFWGLNLNLKRISTTVSRKLTSECDGFVLYGLPTVCNEKMNFNIDTNAVSALVEIAGYPCSAAR